MLPDRSEEQRLLTNIKSRMSEMESLLEHAHSHWGYEDPVYRFYPRFLAIVADGTGKTFDVGMNEKWDATTRPLLEAFFHARFMLKMCVQYGHDIDEPPEMLPSGWAAVLYLYGLR